MIKKLFAAIVTAALLCITVGCGASQSYWSGGTQRENAPVSDSFESEDKSKVILLAGEENCLGYSYAYRLRDGDKETDVSAAKYAEYKNGYGNVEIMYRNMLKPGTVQSFNSEFERVRFGMGYSRSGMPDGAFGPELGIAEYCNFAFPQEKTYILKFAGGKPSSVELQWSTKGGAYYREMLRFFDGGLKELSDSGIDFEVSAFCFVQGDSDSRYNSDGYYGRLSEFADGIRGHYVDVAPDNGITFVDCGISPYNIGYAQINSYKRAFAEADMRNIFVDTVAAGIDSESDNTDRRHYDAISQLRLGNLIGRAVKDGAEYVDDRKNAFVPQDIELKPAELESGYAVEVFCDGLQACSLWQFEINDEYLCIETEVTDGYITPYDGIILDVIGDRRFTVRVNADGTSAVSADLGEATAAEQYGITANISYIGDENLTGYHVKLNVPIGAAEPSVDFSLCNANATRSVKNYSELGARSGESETFATIIDGKLYPGAYSGIGHTFGNAGPFVSTRGWDLSYDDGTENAYAVMTDGVPENMLFFKDVCSTRLYAEARFTVDGVYNNEQYPKFGFKLITENNTGFFFYVDAQVYGGRPTGVNIGYSTFTNGNYNNDWTLLSYTVGNDPSVYTDGNYVKLGVLRDGDTVTLFCNGRELMTLQNNICRLGLTKSYICAASFNLKLKIKDHAVFDGDDLPIRSK